MNISKTGFWDAKEAHIHHAHSKPLEKWIVDFFNKKYEDKQKKEQRIYDLGCGLGMYIKALNDDGFKNVIGVEGDPPEKRVSAMWKWDITQPLTGLVMGDVICLEVMEHIPAVLSDNVLMNIKRTCSKHLILSWAVKGQDGVGHVNCLDNDEVIKLIEKKGFFLLEEETTSARSVIDDTTPWFKNTLLIFKKT